MSKKISELSAASDLADGDLFEVTQSGASKKATAAQVRAGMVPSSEYIQLPGALEATGFVVNEAGQGKTFYSSHATTSVGEGAFSLREHVRKALTHSFKTGAAGDVDSLTLNEDGSAEFTVGVAVDGDDVITTASLSAALAALGIPLLVNTDGDLGRTIFVGSIDPAVDHSPIDGDVWIQQ